MRPHDPPLGSDFYDRDTAQVARDLVGKLLVRHTPRGTVRTRIVETEAYLGTDDPSCHVANGLTPRTRDTWGRPGRAYVYTIYGMHRCLNAITLSSPPYGAVLIRAVEPLSRDSDPDATAGPGRLTRYLHIGPELNGHDLARAPLTIRDDGSTPTIVAGPRIGISKARDWPLRFADAASPYVSRPRPPKFR